MKVIVTWHSFNPLKECFEQVDCAILEARETSRMLILDMSSVSGNWTQRLHKYKRRGRSKRERNNVQRVRWGVTPGKHIRYQWNPCEYAVY